MSKKKITINLNGGDAVTPNDDLKFQLLGSATETGTYAILAECTYAKLGSKNTAGSDTNVTIAITGDVAVLDHVEVGTAAWLKYQVQDAAGNESVASAAKHTSSTPAIPTQTHYLKFYGVHEQRLYRSSLTAITGTELKIRWKNTYAATAAMNIFDGDVTNGLLVEQSSATSKLYVGFKGALGTNFAETTSGVQADYADKDMVLTINTSTGSINLTANGSNVPLSVSTITIPATILGHAAFIGSDADGVSKILNGGLYYFEILMDDTLKVSYAINEGAGTTISDSVGSQNLALMDDGTAATWETI